MNFTSTRTWTVEERALSAMVKNVRVRLVSKDVHGFVSHITSDGEKRFVGVTDDGGVTHYSRLELGAVQYP